MYWSVPRTMTSLSSACAGGLGGGGEGKWEQKGGGEESCSPNRGSNPLYVLRGDLVLTVVAWPCHTTGVYN